MSTSEDDPLSGVNGRLRPRKSYVSSSLNKVVRKSDGKTAQDRPKRTSIPSKASPNKQDDLTDKSDFSSNPQFLCPYCDKKFSSKQTLSKHVRRMHFHASKQDYPIQCLFCNHTETAANIIRHMVDSHPNQYFACLDCHTRFSSTSELAEHKLNVCEKQKIPYRSKLRPKGAKKSKKPLGTDEKTKDDKDFSDGNGFNGIVISCELKPSQVTDEADIEDNITTNLILPSSKNLGNNTVIEKSAVIVLDDIQWNKRIPPNFSFQNTDPDQILSRLGVVHRSPRTNEHSRRDWIKAFDECTQKFERCFDTNFYSKVAGNVQENLSKFLDGSFNFNPDPDNTIKTRKPKIIINAVEGFPILLACEQYSRSVLDGYLPRAIAPKHKWKWDNLENEKNLSPDQIRKNSHINNCIVTLVSNLDIWTQLCMRRKFENKYNHAPLEKKTEKQNIISKELKEILESREIPRTSQAVVKHGGRPMVNREGLDFPASLGLTPSTPRYELQPAVLSGEWVRPRCYVCCACGSQTRDPRALSAHMSNQHPNANVQHYEIVGESLLNADIHKHLYVPPIQISNRTRPLRGIRDCTKCNKSISLEDLHQHMLDCAGDTPAVRRRQSRPRPFGVRRRRPRLPDNTIRKKMRKDMQTRQRRQKTHMRPRPRPRPRSEVGDAETIRKMLADLPAKRHRVMVNPLNMLSRPRRKLEQRNKLILKKRPTDDHKNRRRLRPAKHVPLEGEPATSGENLNQNNSKEEIDDEDDNKPLRPKIKRLITPHKLQHNSVNRKTVMKRPNRRSIRVEQRKNTEIVDTPPPEVIKLPTTDTPQKIDVNREPYNTREQANRGGSNRRESQQRPGCSGTNGNANNYCAPAQNVSPLKHSIARLTASSETHDKSVQFHHSFLVQQECNNTNQHPPSEDHTLFENEAVVTKLDKPPLCNTKGSLDALALQKSKASKPRKGLNDCIAMLKNKLVEPETHRGASTSHISVQCGSDEPIDTGLRAPFVQQLPIVVEKITQAPINSEKRLVQTFTAEYVSQKNQNKNAKSVSIAPTKPNVENDSNVRNASIRRKSATQIEVDGLHKKSIKLNPDIEIIPLPSHKEINSALKTLQKPIDDLQSHLIQSNFGLKNNKSNDLSLQSDANSVNTRIVSHEDISWQKSVETRIHTTTTTTDSSRTPAMPMTNKTLDSQHHQLENHKNKQVYSLGSDISIISQASSMRLEYKEIPLVSYAERAVDIPTSIPQAHGIDSPLDLSSKTIPRTGTMISQDLSVVDGACMMCNYDNTYETLDLSNKSVDTANDIQQEIDTAVDLSVKSITLGSSAETLDLSMNNNSGVDLSIAQIDIDNEPTDLSMRGRAASIDLRSQNIDEDDINLVQDLSTRSVRNNESYNFGPDEEEEEDINPTDLSAKSFNAQHLISGAVSVSNYENITEATNLIVTNEQNYDDFDNESAVYQQQYDMSHSKESSSEQLKVVHSRVSDKACSLTAGSGYSQNVNTPQFQTRLSPNDKTAICVEVATIKPVTKQVSSTNSISQRQDDTLLNTYPSHDDSSLTDSPNNIINTSANLVVESISEYTLPSQATTISPGILESTSPVYAQASTSATEIEAPNSTTLTSSLLSIAGTAITCTTPVVLADTTVATTENHLAAIVSEIKNNSANRESSNNMLTDIENSNSESENIEKELTDEEKATLINDMLKNLTPDKIQKIYVLPDHIKLILAKMPPDHRNQLMSVLPHFLPNSSDSSLPSTTHTVTSASCDMITSQLQHVANLANIVCSASTSQQSLNAYFPTSKLPKALMPPIASTPVQVTNQPQIVDQGLHASNLVKVEQSSAGDVDKYLVDPSSGVLANRPNDFIIKCVIDLTDDDSTPAAVDVVKVNKDIPQGVVQRQPTLPLPKTIRKKSSDQTASLRAVRIKAPSERHKETQLLKKISEEPKPSLSKNHVAEFNKLLDCNKTFDIQQGEISTSTTTQHNNKNMGTDSTLAAPLSSVEVCPSVKTILRQEQEATAIDLLRDKQENTIHSRHSNCKSSEVTSSSIPNQNKKDVENEQDIVVPVNTELTPSKSPECLMSSPHNKETVNSELGSLTKASVPTDTVGTHSLSKKCNDKNTLDDEDSEDDVSLALIVKKKQRDDQELKSITNESHEKKISRKVTSSKKKRKDKKSGRKNSKKRRSSKHQNENSQIPSVTPSDDLPTDEVIEEEVSNVRVDEKPDAGKFTKKNEKSPDVTVEKEQKEQSNIDKGKENYVDPDISKIVTSPEECQEALPTTGKSSVTNEAEPLPESPLNETIADTTYVQGITGVSEKIVEVQTCDKTQDIEEQMHREETLVDSIPEQEPVALVSSGTSKTVQVYKNDLAGSISISDEQKPVEKESNLDKNKNSCFNKISDIESIPEDTTKEALIKSNIKDNVILPRRSRRGKAVHVDSTVKDNETATTNDHITIEKTPLTKKQLIFSKLLLDEENHKNPEAGTTNTNMDECNEVTVTNEDPSNIQETSDKSRATKRKNSPQLKRKSKKKRSLDSNCNQYQINKHNAEHVNKLSCDVNTVNSTTDSNINDSVDGTDITIKEARVVIGNPVSSLIPGPKYLDELNKPNDIEDKTHSKSLSENNNSKLLSIAEKRKLVTTASVILDSNPKRKKTKIHKVVCEEIVDSKRLLNDDTDIKTIPLKETFSPKEGPSTKTTAARRTRSKSVIVKSSKSDFYDPYDIDLEDIPEKAEPFRKVITKCKEMKVKILPKPSEIVFKEVSEKEKSEDKAVPSTSDKDSKLNNRDSVSKLDTVVDATVDDNVIDSDDSSKSDIPLKRYIEEKGKKLENVKDHKQHVDEPFEETLDSGLYDDDNKEKNASTGETSSSLSRETEEQLRSEQFMESFGFFSERKPRKSNLLASKKISETFHIIANESDDIYFGFKDRNSKKRLSETRKSKEAESTDVSKTNTKRGRKKKSCTSTETCYCYICKKEFRRPDNYLRHQMTLLHISKLSEVELRVKTVPVLEEPNYLIPYKQQLDRLKLLTRKLAKRKKNSKSKKIKLPTLEEILENVNKTVREQQLSRMNRSLSRDEALFIDCCELLKESHKNEAAPINPKNLPMTSDVTFVSVAHCSTSGLQLTPNTDTSDGDVDSITAKTILESEEVRNLEYDLISGLKEAAEAASAAQSQIALNYHHTVDDVPSTTGCEGNENVNLSGEEVYIDKKTDTGEMDTNSTAKHKKYPEVKEKMYPDIEEIDMFEDKFDKIKRKCRSQAAAAKQMQPVVESVTGHKGRKKSDKKKVKKGSKKINQNTVLTKGALKGFDGIKVSLPSSEMNLPAAPSTEASWKKKRKNSGKKKRDKKDSESSSKYDSDTKLKESNAKKLDVYEFMDNEDAELFEFRPSTLMERFKSMSNKGTPTTSKSTSSKEVPFTSKGTSSKEVPSTSKMYSEEAAEEKSSESASDGDDFVYMSDDYICSDDETENSLMSCEIGNVKIDPKKNISPLKRKDAVEKNAVMGKIFKHNALRSEKKATTKVTESSNTNFDQLFDSLLEEKPNSVEQNEQKDDEPIKDVENEEKSKVQEDIIKKFESAAVPKPRERVDILDDYVEFMKSPKKLPSRSPERTKIRRSSSPSKYDIPKKTVSVLPGLQGPSTSKKSDLTESDIYGPSTSKKEKKTPMPKRQDFSTRSYEDPIERDDKSTKSTEEKCEEMFNNESDPSLLFDDTGVARQRARRKCTVGKQNVLAESWSSESEPDGFPPRPNSAESVVVGAGRKKKNRKKDGHQLSGRRGKQTTFKKQDTEIRVTSSNRNPSSGDGKSSVVPSARGGECDDRVFGESSKSSVAGPSTVPDTPPSVAGPSGWKGRQRSTNSYWSSEGDEEQEHLQQHGWIVGDSHKKLVTMLAHAKGRKRHNDEKRHSLE